MAQPSALGQEIRVSSEGSHIKAFEMGADEPPTREGPGFR